MNREIEAKLEISKDDYEKYLSFLLENGVQHTKKEQNDIYFSPKYRPFLEEILMMNVCEFVL